MPIAMSFSMLRYRSSRVAVGHIHGWSSTCSVRACTTSSLEQAMRLPLPPRWSRVNSVTLLRSSFNPLARNISSVSSRYSLHRHTPAFGCNSRTCTSSSSVGAPHFSSSTPTDPDRDEMTDGIPRSPSEVSRQSENHSSMDPSMTHSQQPDQDEGDDYHARVASRTRRIRIGVSPAEIAKQEEAVKYILLRYQRHRIEPDLFPVHRLCKSYLRVWNPDAAIRLVNSVANTGVTLAPKTYDLAITAYGRRHLDGDCERALAYFDDYVSKSATRDFEPDVLHAIVRTLCSFEKDDRAFDLFMKDFRSTGDITRSMGTLRVLISRGSLAHVKSLHTLLKEQHHVDTNLSLTLVAAYAGHQQFESVREVIEDAIAGVQATASSSPWSRNRSSSSSSSLSTAPHGDQFLPPASNAPRDSFQHLTQSVSDKRGRENSRDLADLFEQAIVSSSGRHGRKVGEYLLKRVSEMFTATASSNQSEGLCVALVTLYLKFDDAAGAMAQFEKMQRDGMRPSEDLYSSLVGGLCAASRVDEARDLFNRMMDDRLMRPRAADFVNLMKAYRHAARSKVGPHGQGAAYDNVVELVDLMKSTGTRPSAKAHLYAAAAVAEGGYLDMALELKEELNEMSDYRLLGAVEKRQARDMFSTIIVAAAVEGKRELVAKLFSEYARKRLGTSHSLQTCMVCLFHDEIVARRQQSMEGSVHNADSGTATDSVVSTAVDDFLRYDTVGTFPSQREDDEAATIRKLLDAVTESGDRDKIERYCQAINSDDLLGHRLWLTPNSKMSGLVYSRIVKALCNVDALESAEAVMESMSTKGRIRLGACGDLLQLYGRRKLFPRGLELLRSIEAYMTQPWNFLTKAAPFVAASLNEGEYECAASAIEIVVKATPHRDHLLTHLNDDERKDEDATTMTTTAPTRSVVDPADLSVEEREAAAQQERGSALIHFYHIAQLLRSSASSGSLPREVLKHMESLNLKVTIRNYRDVIAHHARHGEVDAMVEVFHELTDHPFLLPDKSVVEQMALGLERNGEKEQAEQFRLLWETFE
eukprot:TRINITY_DN8588_c0_g1_i1.p1 TRINITY_DN8588_c0_g1~~TRINITY_DN8588_c0_g1_i1.p1  ORF type:complete len:1039 (+),score=160.89 TRINITY_DN8588_c0_g1_i1:190-3306(+)